MAGGGVVTGRLWVEGEPIRVECDEAGRPRAFVWQGRGYVIAEICNRWRVSEEWWKAEDYAWREYIKVATTSKLLCLIAHDLDTQQWSLIRRYA